MSVLSLFITFSSSPVIKKMLIKDNPEETKKKRRSYDALDLKMETSKVKSSILYLYFKRSL